MHITIKHNQNFYKIHSTLAANIAQVRLPAKMRNSEDKIMHRTSASTIIWLVHARARDYRCDKIPSEVRKHRVIGRNHMHRIKELMRVDMV